MYQSPWYQTTFRAQDTFAVKNCCLRRVPPLISFRRNCSFSVFLPLLLFRLFWKTEGRSSFPLAHHAAGASKDSLRVIVPHVEEAAVSSSR